MTTTNTARLAALLELISDLVSDDGSWGDKKLEVLDALGEPDSHINISFWEFLSWFDRDENR